MLIESISPVQFNSDEVEVLLREKMRIDNIVASRRKFLQNCPADGIVGWSDDGEIVFSLPIEVAARTSVGSLVNEESGLFKQ